MSSTSNGIEPDGNAGGVEFASSKNMETEQRRGYRALIVEDDRSILRLVKTVLEREQFTVEGVSDGASAIALLREVAYDLLIIDLLLPKVSGDEVLGFIEEHHPEKLRRVIVTTASPRQISCDLLRKICRVLAKPFDIDQLVVYARECAAPDAA
jgi:DNA-binding response OmpR family regulator